MSDNSGQQAVTSFQQQGQVDWIALSNSTISFTLGVVSRLNKAGVDSFTCSIGRIICQKLKLTANGQERIDRVISKLKGWRSYREIVWFGFGERHLVHDLALTEEGITLVALCSAIQGTYGEMFGARVFRQLAIELKAPHEFSPSLHQWRALISVCAGILCAGDFTNLLGSFRQYISPSKRNPYKATEPEAIAKAIVSLGQVAENRRNTHNFIGGVDCSWIAAVAEWLYDLCVEIRNPSGDIIYRSSFTRGTHGATPQIRIIESASDDDPVSILSRSALVPSTVSIIQRGHYGGSEFIRRVGWNTILKESFDERWLTLLLTGEAGKASSRLLRILIVEGLMYQDAARTQGIKANDCAPYASFLASFINVSKTRFPELSDWLEMAEDPLNHDDQQSWSDKSYSDTITKACYCTQDSNALCLRLLFSAILELLSAFHHVEVQPDLLPTISGVEEAYDDSFCLKNCFDTSTEEYLVFSDEVNPFKPMSSMFFERNVKIIQRVYTGVCKVLYETLSYAVCGEGICVFYKALLYPNLPPAKTYQIVALPGIIEYKHTRYTDATYCPLRSSFGERINPAPIIERAASIDLLVDEIEERDFLTMGFLAQYYSEKYIISNCMSVLLAVWNCTKLRCKHQDRLLIKNFQPGHTYAVVDPNDRLEFPDKSRVGGLKFKPFQLLLTALSHNNEETKGQTHERRLNISTVIDGFFAQADYSSDCWLLGFPYKDERMEASKVKVSFRGLSRNIEHDRLSLEMPFACSNNVQIYSRSRTLLHRQPCTRCILQLISAVFDPTLKYGLGTPNRIDYLLMGSCATEGFEMDFDLRVNDEVTEGDELDDEKRKTSENGETDIYPAQCHKGMQDPPPPPLPPRPTSATINK